MKKLLFINLILFSICVYADELKIARISVGSEADIQSIKNSGAGIFHSEQDGFIDIVCDESTLSILSSEGWIISEIVPFESAGLLDIDPEYHTFEELTDELQQLAALHPNISKLDSIGRAEQFERTIWCMKISDNAAVEEDEPALLYIGIHHACEVMGGETILYMINLFLENYGIDPEITQWVDNYEIFFVPMMNPDGHHAVTEGISEFWRKNARDTNNNGIFYEVWGGTWWNDDTDGVDLNRNYDWFWEYGGTGDPLSYYYRGESAFSEHENHAIRDLGFEQNFVCGISFHSYGEVILYPWEFGPGDPSPDQAVMDAMAENLAESFIRDNSEQYDYDIFGAYTGYCSNWFYGDRGGLFFCVEVNPYPLFIPPGSELEERTARYYNGAKYLLDRLGGSGITGHITDAVTGDPVLAQVEITSEYSSQVTPRFNDPEYGRYTRLLLTGEWYNLVITADSYQTVDTTFRIREDTLKVMDFALQPQGTAIEPLFAGQPSEYKINLDCYPNPFNDETIIEYSIADDGYVSLAVYEISGRRVSQLINGYYSNGAHRLKWSGEGLSSGIYIVKLEAETVAVSNKILLIK